MRGGIRLTGDLQATPGINTVFIGIGALLASLVGTTGASMLLIRPLLQTNRERTYRVHTVIFFIFLVSNICGSLFFGYMAWSVAFLLPVFLLVSLVFFR